MTRISYLTVLALTLAGFASAGCTPNKIESRPRSDAAISVSQSAKKVIVNETVTFEVSDQNTLGRKADIRWETTGGKLWNTDGTKRVAQVVFDTPGVYSVTAILNVDDRDVERETRTVDVRPLPR
jgi:hypothetical protein